MRPPYEERFWSRVRKTDRCWLWTAGRVNGYGFFVPSRTSGTRLAHRIAYELLVGPIPEGMRFDHICQNRQCVNPAHLRLLTQSESASESSRHARRWSRPLVCKNGHVRTLENTAINNRGQTVCRFCQRATDRRRYERKKRPRVRGVWSSPPVCRNGHVRTPENTVIDSRGQTVCRICRRAAGRRYHERKTRARSQVT